MREGPAPSALAEVRNRRRIAMRTGLAALLIVSATACIFEKSDFQGGGRADRGGTGQTAEPTSSTEPTAPTATPDGSDVPDAADAADAAPPADAANDG